MTSLRAAFLLLLLGGLVFTSAHAQVPGESTSATVVERYSTVNLFGNDGNPRNFFLLNYPGRPTEDPRLLFVGDRGSDGVELHGTYGETVGISSQVSDINPDGSDSFPDFFAQVGGNAVFAATTGTEGRELWITDGFSSDLLKDINVGSGSSNPEYLTEVGDEVLFFAETANEGVELWATDSTSAGTRLVKDIFPGTTDFNFDGAFNVSIRNRFVEAGGLFFFPANDGVSGFEVWVSDGTTAGTNLLKDITPGTDGTVITDRFASFQGKAYFVAEDPSDGNTKLWVSDGTTAGTQIVTGTPFGDDARPENVHAIGDFLYLNADDTLGNQTLWSYDGISFRDLGRVVPDDDGARGRPPLMHDFNGKAFFFTDDGATALAPWVSDGTASGTQPLAAITGAYEYQGGFSNIGEILPTTAVDRIYFQATNGSTGYELWSTDGTRSGTRLVKDFAPGAADGLVTGMGTTGGALFVGADDASSVTTLFRVTEALKVAAAPYLEDFETDGESRRYRTTNIPLSIFADGPNDHFGRTDGSNISNRDGPYVGFNGFFWGIEDVDDASINRDGVAITFQPVDVSLLSEARFTGEFAAGCSYDPEASSGCYDQGDSLSVRYSTDGGQTFQPGLKFAYIASEATQGVFNAGLAQDTDFDGVGEGTRLGQAALTFGFDLPTGASTVILRVYADFNGSNEEFAFDDFQIKGPGSVVLAAPLDDRSIPALTSETLSLTDVFTEQTASALTYTATSSDEAVATVQAGSDLEQLTVRALTAGTTTISVTAQNDAGDTATDAFVLTVTPPRPEFDVFTRLAFASRECTDVTDVSTCDIVGASRFGRVRPDTLDEIDATEPILVRYVLRNRSSRPIASSTIEDARRGTIASGAAVAAFDSVAVNKIYAAPSAPGLQTTRVFGEAVSDEGVSASRSHRYGLDVAAPVMDLNVRIARPSEECTDTTDITTCDIIGESRFGSPRSDTLAAQTPRDTALVRYVAVNASETTITSLDLVDARFGVILDNADVNIAPFDSVTVNAFRIVPDEIGVTAITASATGRDVAGNADGSTETYGIEVGAPTPFLNVRVASADIECEDVTDVTTCDIIGESDRFGNPRPDTVEVLAGEPVLVRYVLQNRNRSRLLSATIEDATRSEIFDNSDADVAGFDSVVVNRIYPAPATSGLRLFQVNGFVEDAGGNVADDRVAYGINVFGSGLRPIVRVGNATEKCSDVTDVNTCGILGASRFGSPRPDTLDTTPGRPTLVRYVAVNTSGLIVTDVSITDSQYGLITEQTGLSLAPFDSVTVNRIYSAPSTIGADDNGSVVSMTTATEPDGAGDIQTFDEQTGYALNVVGPKTNLLVRTGLASRFCDDPADVSTCEILGASEGNARLETAPGERVLVRYVLENRSSFPLSTVDLRDVTRGEVFFDEAAVTVGGFDSVTVNRIYDAPTAVGDNAFDVQGVGRDAGNNAAPNDTAYVLQVNPPAIDLRVRVARASEECTDVTDVSSCDIIGESLDPTTPRPDTVFALPSAETYLVRYVVRNLGRSSLGGVTIDDDVHGVVASATGLNIVQFDSLVVNRLYTARATPGTATAHVTAQGADRGGNFSPPSSQPYGVQTQGPAFRLATLAGPAAFFCSNVNDPETCSLERMKRMKADKELAAQVLAKNTSDREAVAYQFFNTGTVDFVRHTLVDDVVGTVFADSSFTVAANETATLFRIYDEVAPMGLGRSGTWTAVDTNGDLFSDTSTEQPLPVELVAFTAQVADRSVTLEWTTASEENNAGFEVQRYDAATERWTALAFVEGRGTTSEPQGYQFAAGSLEPNVYTFRLKQVDLDGRFATSEPLEVVLGIDGVFLMTPPAPNPSRSAARFRLTVREAQPVRIEVYDLLGRRVLTAFDDELLANRPQDVQVDTGRLSSGSYFVRVQGETFTNTQRLVVVK